jgi:hypothetical protein
MAIEFSNGFTITKNTLNDNIPGVGEWFFYSDEGNINAGPPTGNGNTIFIQAGTPNVETFNPNANSGTDYIYFAPKDATGADYYNDFLLLADAGGTLTLNQNGNIAAFNSQAGFLLLPDGNNWWFFRIDLSVATQTIQASGPFVFGDPISLTFGA